MARNKKKNKKHILTIECPDKQSLKSLKSYLGNGLLYDFAVAYRKLNLGDLTIADDDLDKSSDLVLKHYQDT